VSTYCLRSVAVTMVSLNILDSERVAPQPPMFHLSLSPSILIFSCELCRVVDRARLLLYVSDNNMRL
jgi:hypothetical protein